MRSDDELGQVVVSVPGEEWIEYGPQEARRRVGFHDYAAIYAVPGLYERVFVDLLQMRTATEVVDRYQRALVDLGRDPSSERVLDLGAGNGIGGELLRAFGVACVVAVDIEPEARRASERDRPGVYDQYTVSDLSTASAATINQLRESQFTALLAFSSIGVGHVTAEALATLIDDLLMPAGLVAFAVADNLLPLFHTELFGMVALKPIATWKYVHRLQSDGSPHHATALIARRS